MSFVISTGKSTWDGRLVCGKEGEKCIGRLLGMDSALFEVKRDAIWKTSGRIAVEIRDGGKPSGISITTAAWWVNLLDLQDDKALPPYPHSIIFTPVDVLKEIVRERFKTHGSVKSGDNKRTECVLIPFSELFKVKGDQ